MAPTDGLGPYIIAGSLEFHFLVEGAVTPLVLDDKFLKKRISQDLWIQDPGFAKPNLTLVSSMNLFLEIIWVGIDQGKIMHSKNKFCFLGRQEFMDREQQLITLA